MSFQPVIYTFGASEYLNSVFESMSILFNFDQRSELMWLYRIAGLLGVLIIALKPFASRGPDGSPSAIDWPWFLRFAILFLVIVVPKTDVRIQDITLKKTYVVTNAPWALSIFGWFTSTLGYGLTEMYESVMGGGMNPIESYSGNGIAFGSSYYNTLPQIATYSNSSMQDFVIPFVMECMTPAVTSTINLKNSGLTREEYFNSPNYKATLLKMNTLWLDNRYVLTDTGTFTCTQLRDKVVNTLDTDSIAILTQSGLTEQQVGDLDNSYIKVATDTQSSSLKQGMMINAIYDSVKAASVKYGNTALADSLYQAQAQLQQATSWRQMSQMASVSLVWLHIAIECMIYALWPLVTFLILFPSGWTVLVHYIKVLFWIQLWPMMYAILNSIIAVYATSKTQALAMQYGGFTMGDFFKIGDLNSGIVTTAGYLSTMVPIITYMIVQQTTGIMNAVGSFVGSTTGNADKAGKEEAMGDMQINRVTVKQSDTAGSETIGQMTSKHIAASGSTTDVGGISTVQSRATENKLVSGVNYQQAAQSQLSNMKSELDSQVGSTKNSYNNARQSLYNAQKGTQASTNHGTGDGHKQDDAITNSLAIMSNIMAKLGGSFGVGSGQSGVGGSFGLDGSLSAKAMNELKNNLSTLKDATNSDAYGDNASISNAFNDVKGFIKSSEKTISMAENYQKAQSIVNSSGYSIQSNGDNEFVKDLRSQGYSNEEILNMQMDDAGKFNALANNFAQKYVKNILGDNNNYNAEGLNHEQTQQKINQLANRHANDGARDKVTGKAQQFINNETGYVNNQQLEMNDRYWVKNEEQNHPGHIIVNQGKEIGGVVVGVATDAADGITNYGKEEAERIANGGNPLGKQYQTGKGNGMNSYTQAKVNYPSSNQENNR